MRLSSVLVLGLSLVATMAAAAPTIAVPEGKTEGEWWEMTNRMSMNGMSMPMPGGGKRVCKPKNVKDDQLANNDNKNCRMTNQRQEGNKFYWEMSCTGEQAFTGKGEMERTGPDAFRGRMTMNSAQGTMDMDMEGHKVGGDCDPYADAKKINAAMGKNEADYCRQLGTELRDPAPDPRVKVDMGCQTRNKAAFCEGVKKTAPQMNDRSYYAGHSSDPAWRAAYAQCGLDADQPLKKHCAAAVGEKDYYFLADSCPAEAQQAADRMCTGSDLTLWSSQGIYGLCEKYSAHAREVIAASPRRQGQAPPAQGDPPAPEKQNPLDKLKKGAKGLGGLFGIPSP